MSSIFPQSVLDIWQKLQTEVVGFLGTAEPVERAIGVSNLYSQIYAILATQELDIYYNIVDIYVDASDVFALLVSRGKLFQVSVTIASDSEVSIGTPVEVIVDFAPATKRSLLITRQADGSPRWFMLTGTTVLNRDGEIDSSSLYDNFIERIAKTGEYPYLDFYHLGKKFRLGEADYAARDGVVLLASGIFDDTVIAEAMLRAYEEEPEYWGASNEYASTSKPTMLRVTDDINIPVYTEGQWIAISVVAEEHASSLFTRFIKEIPMNKRVQAALKKLAGDDEELLETLTGTVDDVNRTVEDENLIRRKQSEDETVDAEDAVNSEEADADAEADTDADVDAETESTEFELDETAIEAIAEVVTQRLTQQTQESSEAQDTFAATLQEIQTANVKLVKIVRSLQETVEQLTRTDDEKQQDWLADLPRHRKTRVAVSYRPSKGKDKDSEEEDESVATYAETAAETLEKIQ